MELQHEPQTYSNNLGFSEATAGVPALERHYTVAELSKMWFFSENTIRRLFTKEPASAASDTPPVDFLIEYHTTRSFLIAGDSPGPIAQKIAEKGQGRKTNSRAAERSSGSGDAPRSALDEVFAQQAQINAPEWTKWEGRQIETSVGSVRQWKNETVVAYSIFNNSDASVEIVPPQIQIAGRRPGKKQSKKSKGILSDQMEIREYKLSGTRLEPGARADGVAVFDRPNFKESTEQLFLQIAQADQVDRPILIRLPFTPPISANSQ